MQNKHTRQRQGRDFFNHLANAEMSDEQFKETFEDVKVPSEKLPLYRNMLKSMDAYFSNIVSKKTDEAIVANWNHYLQKYGINSNWENVILFMAVIMQESDAGKGLAEGYKNSYNYKYHERGGGYMQLTWEYNKNGDYHNQLNFLLNNATMKHGYTIDMVKKIPDYAFVLGTYHPIESACYAWEKGNAIEQSITNHIKDGVENGTDLRQLFYVASMGINGWKSDETAKELVLQKSYSEPDEVPNEWNVRKLTYNATIDALAPGKYKKF